MFTVPQGRGWQGALRPRRLTSLPLLADQTPVANGTAQPPRPAMRLNRTRQEGTVSGSLPLPSQCFPSAVHSFTNTHLLESTFFPLLTGPKQAELLRTPLSTGIATFAACGARCRGRLCQRSRPTPCPPCRPQRVVVSFFVHSPGGLPPARQAPRCPASGCSPTRISRRTALTQRPTCSSSWRAACGVS